MVKSVKLLRHNQPVCLCQSKAAVGRGILRFFHQRSLIAWNTRWIFQSRSIKPGSSFFWPPLVRVSMAAGSTIFRLVHIPATPSTQALAARFMVSWCAPWMRVDMAFLKAEVLIGKFTKHAVAVESTGDRTIWFCGWRTEEENSTGQQRWLLPESDCWGAACKARVSSLDASPKTDTQWSARRSPALAQLRSGSLLHLGTQPQFPRLKRLESSL